MNSCPEGTGCEAADPNAIPLAGEVNDKVLNPFALLPQVASALQLGTRVLVVTRECFDKAKSADRENAPFVRHAVRGQDVTELKARAAMDSIGSGNHREPVGARGMPAIGESESADRIAYGIPALLGTGRDRHRPIPTTARARDRPVLVAFLARGRRP